MPSFAPAWPRCASSWETFPSGRVSSFARWVARPQRREAEVRPRDPFCTVAAMSEIAVVREGEGPEVLLVHGGASPGTTWGALASLRARWTLAFVHRRGYPPSPPPAEGRQDFLLDADDLVPLLDARPHVVAHSYGVLGALIAATRTPAQVRSLTLI